MRHKFLALLVICVLLLNACGRDLASTQQRTMSNEEALAELQNIPSDGSVSPEEFVQLLEDLQKSGKVKVNDGYNATSGSVDMTQLVTLLSMLQGGQSNSLLGLASGLVNNAAASGTTSTQLNSKISNILVFLQMAAPFISMIAPQYAPMIQALVTILPVIITMIQSFKKPASSAWLLHPAVARA